MRTAWLLTLAALVACAGIGDGEPNLVACLVDDEQAVMDLDTAPTGFTLTPAEALARAVGHWSGHLDRAAGGRVDLTLRIDADGELTLQRRSWQPSPDRWRAEAADGLDCEDAYALPASVELLALPDLVLAGALLVTVTASGVAGFDLRIAAAENGGSAAPAPDQLHDPDEVSTVDLLLHGHRTDGPWSGEVGFGIGRHHGAPGDPDGAVSYTVVDYGTWTAGSSPPPP